MDAVGVERECGEAKQQRRIGRHVAVPRCRRCVRGGRRRWAGGCIRVDDGLFLGHRPSSLALDLVEDAYQDQRSRRTRLLLDGRDAAAAHRTLPDHEGSVDRRSPAGEHAAPQRNVWVEVAPPGMSVGSEPAMRRVGQEIEPMPQRREGVTLRGSGWEVESRRQQVRGNGRDHVVTFVASPHPGAVVRHIVPAPRSAARSSSPRSSTSARTSPVSAPSRGAAVTGTRGSEENESGEPGAG